MTSHHLLDTSTVSLGDIFSNGKLYYVPSYQRDYSWDEENWEELWIDILEMEAKNQTHYMGAVVFQEAATGLQIIDGQQRLATLSLLVLAILWILKELSEKGVEPEENNERRDLLYKQFIGTKDPASLRSSSKLRLNENDNPFYQQFLIQFRTPNNLKKLRASERRLWKAYQFFVGRVNTSFASKMNGHTLASFLNDVVARQLAFIQIRVDDELSAFKVFETLNARGMELTTADLLKNYLFSKAAGSEIDLAHVREQWQKITSIIPLTDFPDFLRHYINSRQRYVRKERLFSVLRELATERQGVFDLLDELENAAYWYQALDDPYDEQWTDLPDCRENVRALNLFRATQFKPLILAWMKRFPTSNPAKLLRICVVVSFRYTIISQKNPSRLEEAFNAAAIAVSEGTATTEQQAFSYLKPIYVEDEEFRENFSRMEITPSAKKKLARYILAKLEEHCDQADLDYETGTFTVEHILPENPSGVWDMNFKEADRERYTYRLGNLTLLEGKANWRIGNDSFEEKKAYYQTSKYRLTSKIEASEWTPKTIETRQKQMSKWAQSIWRVGDV